jgi:flagellar basal-body rod protein FlgF
MIYGLYLSATGVISSVYRQDIIANNMANSETVGFKKDLATFYQRPTAAQENPAKAGSTDPMLESIGGGSFASPTQVDTSQGDLESTDNQLDLAILGQGYFTVGGADGTRRLTRDGRFRVSPNGNLTLSTDQANPILNPSGTPIVLDPNLPFVIKQSGIITQKGEEVAQIGLTNVADPSKLTKDGGSLLNYPIDSDTAPFDGQLQVGSLERSNVDPAKELTELMDTQRQLEANANMIHYQDETLGELVNTVGKVS